MKPQPTKDAALSRLFGSDAPEVSRESDELSSAEPRIHGGVDKEEPGAADEVGKEVLDEETQHDEPAVEEERGEVGVGRDLGPPGPGGYLGMGKYARGDGIVERITPYVRPDQAEALRIAVARKRDPRGKDISQIVQSLLDEAGYRGDPESR